MRSTDWLDKVKSPVLTATTKLGENRPQSTHSVKVEYASILGAEKYPKTLITKWVDYSSKYGIGYKLSNGCYGVLYNDSTKMILNKNCFDFVYIWRENYSKESIDNLVTHHNFADYPQDLKKKVVLIQHFKGYLDGAKYEPILDPPHPALLNDPDREDKYYQELFLKKWKRAKKAILFRLSNKVI